MLLRFYYFTLHLPRGKVHLQTRCMQRLPYSYLLLDLPDPSKTQSNVGTVIIILIGPRQPGQDYFILSQFYFILLFDVLHFLLFRGPSLDGP